MDMDLDWANADWNSIAELGGSQTVVGVMMDGLVKLPDNLRPSKQLFFNLILRVNDIERKNDAIERVAPVIMGILRDNGYEPLLLKGQGMAVYYKQPKHRISGDIDLFVGFDNAAYKRVNDIIKSLASQIGSEKKERKHMDYVVMDEVVEVHGSITCTISKKCDGSIAEWTTRRLAADNVVIENGHGKITTPPVNFNAIYVFIHFLNHYMNGGIGLRHVCDWMMFLHGNYDKIDMTMLERDVEQLGVRKFWAVFASVSVTYLGYPKDKMPMYDPAYNKRGEVVIRHIFKTGNFGVMQKKWQINHKSDTTTRKIITFVGQVPVYLENFRLFPRETLHCFGKFLVDGVNDI